MIHKKSTMLSPWDKDRQKGDQHLKFVYFSKKTQNQM